MEALIEIVCKLFGTFFMEPRLGILLYRWKEVSELRTGTIEGCGDYGYA